MPYLAGIIITFFLAVLLIGKRNKTAADRILFAWLCVIAFHLLLFYLFITGKFYNYPLLMGIHLPFPLLHGPFLFVYTAELTCQQPKKRIVALLHFLPAIILYVIMIPFFSMTASEKINVYLHNGAGYEEILRIAFWAIIISGIAYVVAALFLLRRYRKSIEDEFSNTEKINLAWLRYLIYGIAVIWIAVIMGNDPVIYGIVSVYVFLLGYFGIKQVGIFTSAFSQNRKLSTTSTEKILQDPGSPVYTELLPEDDDDPSGIVITTPKVKYEKSGLGEEQAERIYKHLVGNMTNQKLFSDSELTLAVLAKTLDVHPNHLSQVINSYEGKNFYDFINFHRVEEFKKLAPLPDNRNYTLLSLAYQCGFNSKTSFNRNFKKATGVSPTEWLQQFHISLN
ncbi:MAG TPA: helix-turn-helix domain-containing protein [Chitinophagaceae bacterium]|nr:helix-turn-helix domain-containing protein [Chitinophagaceae bacterium]